MLLQMSSYRMSFGRQRPLRGAEVEQAGQPEQVGLRHRVVAPSDVPITADASAGDRLEALRRRMSAIIEKVRASRETVTPLRSTRR